MKVSLAQVETILKTLPIGLYALSRVETTLSADQETSFYNPVTNSITISYPIIALGLEKVTNPDLVETAVRTMLYHEVSHAILTPRNIYNTDIRNIAEDERIETLLRNYYLGVDFKWLVYQINDTGTTPKTALELFFNVVRLRKGTPAQLKLVREFIDKWQHLSSADTHRYEIYEYCNDIEELFQKITGVSSEFPDAPPTVPMPSEGEGKGKEDKEGTGAGEGDNGESGEQGAGAKADKDGDEQALAKAKAEQEGGGGRGHFHGAEEISAVVQKTLSQAVNRMHDTTLHNNLQQILQNFNKKNNSGSAMASYSGILNPRACGREDYRFFDRMATVNGANSYGTLHLNLFIDRSGSFRSSQTKVNTLLHSLILLERSVPNFSFDVVTTGETEELLDKEHLFLECNGGNRITPKAFDLVKMLQKPNTYNYNIVLFDGDAHSDSSPRLVEKVSFKPYNINNCTIISDTDNRKYIQKSVYKAKVIYTNNYVEELYDNVLTVLRNAFR